ncbi:MAG TPA: glycosyltransferase [Baekduia sp.]|uniref:glycosyltransferase n=1 Tax=Baekduia sp. TaxID=2600305 RepID=UPI002C6B7AA5|nr:glycosyltransferase [Baekduia sp.]HMJ33346.1 glycosyltransferase [Baekduia sp.]
MSAGVPSVWVLVAAYDAEPYVGQAVRSALAQDYPPDRLHVVVVDDGSTDGTAAVVAALAEQHPARVTLVRQENRGSVGAVNRAAEAVPAGADFLAILDADDAWPADKIAAQVELLTARPDVGLVYTDMRVIDGTGAVLQESWLQGVRPPTGRGLPTFLRENLVTGSSIVVRGTLREALFPIPDDMAWADWWLAARAAQVSEVAYLPLPRTLYRFHGTNMSLGSQGPARLRELRKGLALQRWFLRRVEADAVSVSDLEQIWDGFARLAQEALEAAGTPFASLVDVRPADGAEAAALGVRARALLAAGDVHEALVAAVRGAAADPQSDAVRDALVSVRAAVPDGVGPQPLRGARPLVVCLEADEVVRDPAVLGACAAALADLPGVTLAIDATSFDQDEAAAKIGGVAEALGLADDDRVDLALVTGPLDELGYGRLRAGTTARLGTRRSGDGTPWFAPGSEPALRELLLSRAARASPPG